MKCQGYELGQRMESYAMSFGPYEVSHIPAYEFEDLYTRVVPLILSLIQNIISPHWKCYKGWKLHSLLAVPIVLVWTSKFQPEIFTRSIFIKKLVNNHKNPGQKCYQLFIKSYL